MLSRIHDPQLPHKDIPVMFPAKKVKTRKEQCSFPDPHPGRLTIIPQQQGDDTAT